MFSASRIVSGVAVSLLANANPPTDPKPIVEDGFRRGFELGLSLRVAARDPTHRLLLEREARHGPC